jgi:xylan 1,4-beta-xylosidase
LKPAGLFLLLALGPPAAAAPQAAVRVVVQAESPGEPLVPSRFGLGQGGLSSEPMFHREVELLRPLELKQIRLFVQEYYGLYPARGVYRWELLDRAVDDILSAGARPLLCLAMKPRALFPALDQDQVHPSSYPDWEEFVERLVKHLYARMKHGGLYWEVTNEPDIGEAGGCPSRFRPADYVVFYEHTARAVLRADPEARVGGPALADSRSPILKTLLDASSERKIPLHFVSWHIYSSDPARIGKTVEEVKELLRSHPGLRCETVLDEWNMSLSEPRPEPAFQPCFILETTRRMLEAGLDLSAYYQIRDRHVSPAEIGGFLSPPGTRAMVDWWNRTPQYDGLFDFQGVLRPSFFAFKLLASMKGGRLPVESPAGVQCLASRDREAETAQVLLWNFALEPPPPVEVELQVEKLGGSRWSAERLVLDAAAASSDENARLRPERRWAVEAGQDARDRFQLAPYGAALVVLKNR